MDTLSDVIGCIYVGDRVNASTYVTMNIRRVDIIKKTAMINRSRANAYTSELLKLKRIYLMATMTLPLTNVVLPSDEWKMQSFMENKAFSYETTCYKAVLVHLPTKFKFYVSNEGHGGSDMMDWDHRDPNAKEALDAWKQFVKDCIPVLQASVADEEEEWIRNLYDNTETVEDGSILAFFVEELINQKSLSRKRGTVVRKDPNSDIFDIYNGTPEQLKGRIVGEYWDKKAKNWVSL